MNLNKLHINGEDYLRLGRILDTLEYLQNDPKSMPEFTEKQQEAVTKIWNTAIETCIKRIIKI